MNVDTRLPHDPSSVPRARRAVDGLETALDDETVATVRLLVSELVTNSVRHGSPDQAGEIELSVAASPETVRVEVADSGPGFATRPRFEGQDEGSGWGLHLLDALSDRWGTERNGHMRVWFELVDSGAFSRAAAIPSERLPVR